MPRCDPAATDTAASSHSCPQSPGQGALSSLAFTSPAPVRDAPDQLPFFSKCLPGHLTLVHRLGQQLLRLRVFRLECFQSLGIRNFHAAILAALQVVARIPKAVLTAQFLQPHAPIGLPQEDNYLFRAESLLHVQPPGRG